MAPRAAAADEHTLAISLQVLPASLMVLSLFSSAGVHGVFVRDFLGAGIAPGLCVEEVSCAEGPAFPISTAGATKGTVKGFGCSMVFLFLDGDSGVERMASPALSALEPERVDARPACGCGASGWM